jgi:hypothetical protein
MLPYFIVSFIILALNPWAIHLKGYDQVNTYIIILAVLVAFIPVINLALAVASILYIVYHKKAS